MKAKDYPSQDTLRQMFEYDAETGDLIWKVRPADHFSRVGVANSWNGKHAGKVTGTLLHSKVTGKKYLQTGIGGKLYLNHRLAYILHYGEINNIEQIDHIDGNGLNNRIDNLRLVSGYDENNKNRRLQSNNKSGASGVSWCRKQNSWHARINTEGGRITIGYFVELGDAIAARKQAEMKYNFHENHGQDRPL